jgi:hypothetical protein
MPEARERAALAGVVLAVAAGAACCALPLIVASGALATLGAWVLNPVAGALAGVIAVVIVVAAVRARRPCSPDRGASLGEPHDGTRDQD